jgi:hypothetical protein
MSGTTLRAVIAIVFFIHGVGHSMGVIPALRQVNLGSWSSRSWLLTDLLGDTASRVICIILYGTALVGFIAAALGLLGWVVPHDSWRTLALVSAVISLVAIALYWNAFVSLIPNKVGAVGVDIAVLVCLLVLNWPTEADIGF